MVAIAALTILLRAVSNGELAPVPAASHPTETELAGSTFVQQVEDDWLQQAWNIEAGVRGPVSTETDARGGCDGIKNGKYAFHTGQEPNPWWQVDLGTNLAIGRVVVFNRLDYPPGLHNTDNLRLLTSDDGKSWTLRHEIRNQHFGGVSGAPPLEIRFPLPGLRARFMRLQIPSDAPIFFHLDEVEIYSAEAPGANLALHRTANQSSISQWSTVKPLGPPSAERQYPTSDWIERGRRLGEELGRAGIDCIRELAELREIERRSIRGGDSAQDIRRADYLHVRRVVRRMMFAQPALNLDRLLVVKRFTQETYPDVCLNHMPWVSRPGGDICILSATGGAKFSSVLGSPGAGALKTLSLLNGALGPGHVHGLDLWWEADRVVFGFARAKSAAPPEGWLDRSRSYDLRRTVEPIHIYEIYLDGRNLRQLTTGEWSDLDPTYAADGSIVFVSERCRTSLQCNEYDKDETSCNLYVMRPDGSGIRRLSVNKDGDYLPHSLDDGTIAYVRWEYHERSWAFIQSIWTIRPDGTSADAVFKQHFVNPWALEDTRSIPGSSKLVCVAAGHHTLAVGPVVVVDPAKGINNPRGMQVVTPEVTPTEGGMDGDPVSEGGTRDGGGLYSTPWALSEKTFLASYTYSNKETDAKGYAVYVIDVFGNKELICRDPEISCFLPMPLGPRPRPPIFPPMVDLTKSNATCVISDVSFGSEEVAGRIRYVRIAEPIGWPYDNRLGGQRYGEKGPHLVNWTPIRILGDVPVEPDGSAHFEVPADTAVYFQLLDENRMELRRMRSFISFQPGEHRACAGCHETRGISPRPGPSPLAAAQPPRAPVPPPWGDRPVSFLRDIQPILDRHCTVCHGGLKPAGGLDFSGGLTDWSREFVQAWGLVPGYGFNRAFETIARAGLVAVAEPNLQDASVTPSLAYGAHQSKLLQALDDPAHRRRVRLAGEERLSLTMWMDANAPYHDAFVNKRPDQKCYDLAVDTALAARISEFHERRCAACHKAKEISRLDWINIRQPDRSLFLSAPLPKAFGGTQTCLGLPYKDRQDPDYNRVRDLVAAAAARAKEHPRRDLQAIARE